MKVVSEGRLFSMEEPGFDSVEERLRRAESLREIEECVLHYTRCADMADPIGMAACFTSDARLRWTPDGEPVACGRKAILRHFEAIMGRARAQEHFCTNFQILFRSAGLAVGECNMFSWQMWKDGSRPSTICSGKYEFKAMLEEGQWRLASLCMILNAKIESGGIADGRIAEHLGRPWPPKGIGE